jgi:hypothetical protein
LRLPLSRGKRVIIIIIIIIIISAPCQPIDEQVAQQSSV